VTYGGTSFFSIFLLLSAFFSSFGVCAGYKVTFHDIGQGNCTVVTSPSKKVLVIDAGSSNTTGIPEFLQLENLNIFPLGFLIPFGRI